MARYPNVSLSVIRRLPRYYRFLEGLIAKDIDRISSREFAEAIGVTASQIRQDLNCFGGFGQQGYGYNVKNLHNEIGAILGLENLKSTIIMGAGNLGLALANYIYAEKPGFRIDGIFDNDTTKIGNKVGDVEIENIASLKTFVKENKPEVAVLCVPDEAVKALVKELVEVGVRSFWNFSHYDIELDYPDNVAVENVNLGDSLMILSFQTEELD